MHPWGNPRAAWDILPIWSIWDKTHTIQCVISHGAEGVLSHPLLLETMQTEKYTLFEIYFWKSVSSVAETGRKWITRLITVKWWCRCTLMHDSSNSTLVFKWRHCHLVVRGFSCPSTACLSLFRTTWIYPVQIPHKHTRSLFCFFKISFAISYPHLSLQLLWWHLSVSWKSSQIK